MLLRQLKDYSVRKLSFQSLHQYTNYYSAYFSNLNNWHCFETPNVGRTLIRFHSEFYGKIAHKYFWQKKCDTYSSNNISSVMAKKHQHYHSQLPNIRFNNSFFHSVYAVMRAHSCLAKIVFQAKWRCHFQLIFMVHETCTAITSEMTVVCTRSL